MPIAPLCRDAAFLCGALEEIQAPWTLLIATSVNRCGGVMPVICTCHRIMH